MLVDLLDRTLELPLQSEIITQPYINFLAHQYELSHNGAFGVEHWFRTLINGRILAEKTRADIAVIEHFAMLHDIKRQDEHRHIEHGARAADFANSLVGAWIHLDHSQMLKLDEAIRFHSMGRLSRDITVQVCWDSNLLDLGRLGDKLDPSYLGTRVARDPTFIKEALHRSKRRFVHYDFRG